MDARIPVRVGDCTCPDSPHPDGDEVYLSPTVPFRLGLAAERILVQAGSVGTEATEDALAEAYVRMGVVGWNLEYLNGKGVPEPRPLDVTHLLADWTLSRSIAEKADGIYSEVILRPFLPTPRTRSPSGPPDDTTSPPTTRTPSRRKRSSAITTDGAP
jgi:hypothetical protein